MTSFVRLLVVGVLVAPAIGRGQGSAPLRVLHSLPAGVARPGSVLTVTFDRPVAGSIERSVDVRRIVRLEPPIDAVITWRDPSTLRVVPREPLPPGTSVTVAIDTTFSAFDGTKLAAPFHRTFHVAGAVQYAAVPAFHPTSKPWLAPDGKILLGVTGPVDTGWVNRVSRLEFATTGSCAGQPSIRLQTLSMRPVDASSPWGLQYGARSEGDANEIRFRRVVELRASADLPPSCEADVVLPAFGEGTEREVRYGVHTPALFQAAGFWCPEGCAPGKPLHLTFSAPVRRTDIERFVRIQTSGLKLAPGEPTGQSWVLTGRIAPRMLVSVSVDPRLTDLYGRSLTGSLAQTITIPDRTPDVAYHASLTTLSTGRPTVRLRHVNVDSIDLTLYRVPDSLRTEALSGSFRWRGATKLQTFDSATVQVDLRAPHNVEQVSEIPLTIPSTWRGALVAFRATISRAQVAPDSTGRQKRGTIEIIAVSSSPIIGLVQVTDLMAHARLDAPGGGAVLVTSTRTGTAIRGATVRLRMPDERIIATGTTDATGVARLAVLPIPLRATQDADAGSANSYAWPDRKSRPDPAYIEVERNGDRSVTPAASGYALWQLMQNSGATLARDDDDGDGQVRRVMVFSDRAIYRPGEIVHVSAIVRDGSAGAFKLPDARDSVRWRVARVDRANELQHLRDTVTLLSRHGTASDSFRLPAAAALGTYYIRLERKHDHRWRPEEVHDFRVAEYRAPEFTLTVDADSVPSSSDSIRATISARLLFDAPLARAPVQWQAAFRALSPWEVRIPGLEDRWIIGDHRWWFGQNSRRSTAHYESGTDTLSDQGRAVLSVPTAAARHALGSSVTLDVAVTDANRQVVTSTVERALPGAGVHVAVRQAERAYWWTLGQPRRVEVVAVRFTGERVAGVRVRWFLVARRWAERIEKAGPTGRWEWMADTVATDSIVSRSEPVTVLITPRVPGVQELVFETGAGADSSTTALTQYVFGGSSRGGWGETPERLPVVLSRPRYGPGDRAEAQFTSPFDRAEAWITLERERVLWQERRIVGRGATTIAIQVPEAAMPNAVVSVLLIRSGDPTRRDSLHQRLRLGFAAMRVDEARKRLAVSIEASAPSYRPGTRAQLELRVRDHDGRPVREGAVTVWAVDEGVLSLTGFASPDPMRELYQRIGHSVGWATTLAAMPSGVPPFSRGMAVFGSQAMSLSSLITASRAADETSLFDGIRGRFLTTAFFRADVPIGSDGIARLDVPLPDNLTTYRVMAVAVSGHDRFGSGEAPLLITKPLLARAALPRFVRPADEVDAGAIINTRIPGDRSAVVEARGDGLEFTGPTEQRVMLSVRGADARFTWRVKRGDSAVVELGVSDGVEQDAVRTVLPVRPDQNPRAHTLTAFVRDTATLRFVLPAGIDPERSHLTIRIGTSALPIIQTAHRYLRIYPYYCTEQLASGARVLIALLRLQRERLAAPGDSMEYRQQLQVAVDELSRRQGADGGIGYWTTGSWTNAWLTAYAGAALVDARDLGVVVAPAVTEGLGRFLATAIEQTAVLPDTTYGNARERSGAVAMHLGQRLAALELLRRLSRPAVGHEAALHSEARRMQWEDRARLVLLAHAGDHHAVARTLLQELWAATSIAGNRVEFPDSTLQTRAFPSRIRPAARLLAATLLVDPQHPRLGALVERIVQRRRAESLWNTQDYASAAVSLAEFMRRQQQAAAEVRVSSPIGGELASMRFRAGDDAPAELRIPLAGLVRTAADSAELPLLLRSAGAAYVSLTVDEVARERALTPDVRGLVIERWYERYDNGQAVTEVREGDLVRVRLRVTAPADREFVAIEDPLPAGLEAVDLGLRTSSTLGPFATPESEEARRRGAQGLGDALGWSRYSGMWYGGWWSPWEHTELRDDRAVFFARTLWSGSHTASYVARATTAGRFVRPSAHGEEMYNPALNGRSDGGWFVVKR